MNPQPATMQPKLSSRGRTPLAWRNLLHHKPRLLAAVSGVAFTLILIFLQRGFLHAVYLTATVVYDHLRFDVALVADEYQNFYFPGGFPRQRLDLVRDVDGVADVQSFFANSFLWRCPPGPDGKDQLRAILMMGIELQQPPFELEGISEAVARLEARDGVLLDTRSRPEFGLEAYRNGFSNWELSRQKVRVVGTFTMGTGFGADGALLTSAETYARLQPYATPDITNLGLVRTDPSANPETVAAAIQEKLKRHGLIDVVVETRAELLHREADFWRRNTAVGIIFSFGVLVALIVGVVVVYQILSADIAAHRAEYATLRAMGYSNRYLSGVVLTQALLLAVAGYLPALVVSLALYRVTEWIAGIRMEMTVVNLVLVFLLALVMCALSGMISVRKIKSAAPADLF